MGLLANTEIGVGSSIATSGKYNAAAINIFHQAIVPWAKTPEQGASTSLYGVLSPELRGGEYLEDCHVSDHTHPQADDFELAADLWRFSAGKAAALVNLTSYT